MDLTFCLSGAQELYHNSLEWNHSQFQKNLQRAINLETTPNIPRSPNPAWALGLQRSEHLSHSQTLAELPYNECCLVKNRPWGRGVGVGWLLSFF